MLASLPFSFLELIILLTFLRRNVQYPFLRKNECSETWKQVYSTLYLDSYIIFNFSLSFNSIFMIQLGIIKPDKKDAFYILLLHCRRINNEYRLLTRSANFISWRVRSIAVEHHVRFPNPVTPDSRNVFSIKRRSGTRVKNFVNETEMPISLRRVQSLFQRGRFKIRVSASEK